MEQFMTNFEQSRIEEIQRLDQQSKKLALINLALHRILVGVFADLELGRRGSAGFLASHAVLLLTHLTAHRRILKEC